MRIQNFPASLTSRTPGWANITHVTMKGTPPWVAQVFLWVGVASEDDTSQDSLPWSASCSPKLHLPGFRAPAQGAGPSGG